MCQTSFINLNLFNEDQREEKKQKKAEEILSKWHQYLSVSVLATQERRQLDTEQTKKAPVDFRVIHHIKYYPTQTTGDGTLLATA